MQVFWEKGYDGASLRDLTAAMRIQAPSLYAAFGNKQALFEQALSRYLAGPVAFMNDALREASAYAVADRILRQAAEFLTRDRSRHGCMTIQAGLVGGDDSEPARRRLTALRLRGQNDLRKRFERAKSEGDLPKDTDAADLARFITAVFQGMTIQAINGATRQELLRLAATSLRAWPR